MPGMSTDAWIGAAHDPSLAEPVQLKGDRKASVTELPAVIDGKPTLRADIIDDELFPTEEEIRTLPRVSDKIPWRVYTIAFVELCERFSYYGTQILFQNFVQRKLQTSTGRAPHPGADVGGNPGALGRGQQTATGMSTFFSFWCYVTPLIGAWISDTYLGRYNTILISVGIAIVGHVLLVAAAAPKVLTDSEGAFAAYVVAIIIFGIGTGGFKPNIAPLIAEQIAGEKLRVETDAKTGKKQIVDPAVTSSRIYNWFYLFINIGALIGQLTMSYAALYVGYWLAFFLPTVMFLLCPLVLILCKKTYRITPPSGSLLGPAVKALILALRSKWSWNPVTFHRNIQAGGMWENIKPSRLGANKPKWMTFDDAFVDELRRGWMACLVFLFYPLYWLTYNQLNNNLTSQADTMQHPGVPPEIVNNLDPLALVILIPVFDLFIYPALRKAGIRFTPIKRITLGFILGALAMVYAAVIQQYIYSHNECGKFISEAEDGNCPAAPISIWAQSGSYILIAMSEIFASITSLEYAFTKAPKSMRSMVSSFALFMTALASALGEAMVPLSTDPLLVWNYGANAIIAGVAGIVFYIAFLGMDRDEDLLNSLPTGHIGHKDQVADVNRRASVASANAVSLEKA